MTQRCTNCNQLLLDDDTACWQCGQPVMGGGANTGAARATAAPKPSQPTTDVPALLVYSILTVVVILLALAVTIYLGRQPLVQATSQRAPDGWLLVANVNRDFTLIQPENWMMVDADASDQPDDPLNQVLDRNPIYATVLAPLGELTDELYTLYIAASEPLTTTRPGAFLVVVRSRTLNQLTPDDALRRAAALAEANGLTLYNAEYVDNYDKSHVYLNLLIPTEAGLLHCQQQFIPGRGDSLLLSACGSDQNEIGQILDSFQRLTP